MPKPKDAPRFAGFVTPFYTQIPNVVFDELLPHLSGAEWKALAYILRRTFGWHKDADDIGLRQLTEGTGLSKSTVAVALKSLEEWGIIERSQNRDEDRGDLPTTYRVRISDRGRDENRTPPASEIGHPRVRPSDTQKIDPENIDKESGAVAPPPIGITPEKLAKFRGERRLGR